MAGVEENGAVRGAWTSYVRKSLILRPNQDLMAALERLERGECVKCNKKSHKDHNLTADIRGRTASRSSRCHWHHDGVIATDYIDDAPGGI